MLRRILLASAGVTALTGAALAADLPFRAPPPVFLPPPPVWTWTGFYIGLNAGGTWSNSDNFATSATNIQFCTAGCVSALKTANAAAAGATALLSINDDGFVGGGQIGYNYQFANSWVAGIEADFQGTSAKGNATASSLVGLAGSLSSSIGTTLTVNKSLDFIGNVRGRIGFLITPTLLVYGTGGFAYGRAASDSTFFQKLNGISSGIATTWAGAANISQTRGGWAAGGGGEWMFLPHWSAKIEYLYYGLGTLSASTLVSEPFLAGFVVPGRTAFFTNAAQTTTRFNSNIVRAGLNYHF
jgi:outer membrane immunogenic protein